MYSEKRIADNYTRLKDALRRVYPKSRILYAAKANTDLTILRLLRRLGSEIEFIDWGGGLWVPYKPGEEEVDLDAFLGELVGFIKEQVEARKNR